MGNLWFYQLPVLGRCGIEASDTHIIRVLLGAEADGACQGQENALTAECARQLTEYLSGERRRFELPVQPDGTSFQKQVWDLLGKIPWGEHRTYGQVAALLGIPGGARAVGNAVGANPVPILIPCHRVLAAGGILGGFRLGTDMKRELLKLEGIEYRGRKTENF